MLIFFTLNTHIQLQMRREHLWVKTFWNIKGM